MDVVRRGRDRNRGAAGGVRRLRQQLLGQLRRLRLERLDWLERRRLPCGDRRVAVAVGRLLGRRPAFERGYKLWASDQSTRRGGLLGHPVKLDIVSDASSPAQVVTNYQKLICSDHAQLVFGPFSTLLTVPVLARSSTATATRSSRAPAAPRPCSATACTTSSTSACRSCDNLVTFAKWVASLPPAQRPKTAAYATSDDPFTQPQIPQAQSIMSAAGDQDRLQQGVPGRGDRLHADRQRGGLDATPTRWCSARSTCRRCRRSFTPSSSSTTTRRSSSPPPARTRARHFVKAVGGGNAERNLVPERLVSPVRQTGRQPADGQGVHRQVRWDPRPTSTPTWPRPTRSARWSPRPSTATHSLDNAKIISYLHSGVTLNSVQGPVKFDAKGENGAAAAFVFQWQKGNQVQALPDRRRPGPSRPATRSRTGARERSARERLPLVNASS